MVGLCERVYMPYHLALSSLCFAFAPLLTGHVVSTYLSNLLLFVMVLCPWAAWVRDALGLVIGT